ncbi:carbohydrate ABC transporter permease [Alicyclobacillus fastidiosus]|uniref:Carbohydrate ABC transporter permease n=1 Tax=Alicyclobacillus fastidiosus TaxID=392011 RepID=A0ABY6ZR46_9BACL|nr:carbohydrate ABC transporter permease [Alicyclobacillus fastidiosus]WAH44631.1 carbohydrate ABC transporter permease [Alicyclobacillus fastidiosus]
MTRRMSRGLIYLVLIAGSVLMLLPFIWLIRSSLMSDGQIFKFPPEWVPHPFEWGNYVQSLTEAPFLTYFKNTMIIEIGVVPGTLLTAGVSAYSFARLRWKGKRVVFGLIISTLMLPYAVTLIPTFIMWKSIGAVNTFWPLIVPAWFGGGAFNVFLLRQFFLGIPRELDEAAYIDGATPWQVFWRVVVPLSKPAFIAVGIFTFIGVWNDFLSPIIYLNSDSKFTLALGLAQFLGQYQQQWGYLMAASTVVLLPIVILFFVLQRYFVQGITLTGSKG